MTAVLETDRMSRRQVADLLEIHPDSVTRRLPSGLASAVVAWGGRGKEMYFSRLAVLRWWRAATCARDGGRRCYECWEVGEDCEALGEHLIAERHGVGGCEECKISWEVIQPCAS